MIISEEFSKHRFKAGQRTLNQTLQLRCKQIIEEMLHRDMTTDDIAGCIPDAINDFMVSQVSENSAEWEQFNYQIAVIQAMQCGLDTDIQDKKSSRLHAITEIENELNKLKREYVFNEDIKDEYTTTKAEQTQSNHQSNT